MASPFLLLDSVYGASDRFSVMGGSWKLVIETLCGLGPSTTALVEDDWEFIVIIWPIF